MADGATMTKPSGKPKDRRAPRPVAPRVRAKGIIGRIEARTPFRVRDVRAAEVGKQFRNRQRRKEITFLFLYSVRLLPGEVFPGRMARRLSIRPSGL